MKFFFLSFAFSPLFCQFSTSNYAESAILMNMETGKIIYEKNAYERRYPASVTKIATALYALEKYKPVFSENIVVEGSLLRTATMLEKKRLPQIYPSYVLEPDGTSINLMAQEKISIKTLFYGLMLGSGNDAANVIAYHCCKNITMFVNEMNQYLKSIGCKDTHFTNPHGLHDLNHYTTACDLAFIAKKAMQNTTLSEIVKTTTYQREDTNKQKSYQIIQTNRMLKAGPSYYSKAIGIKTGYTSNAGFNLVSAAINGERKLIAVILGSKNSEARYQDAQNLFETAFNETKIQQRVYAKGADVFKNEIKGGHDILKASLEEDVDIYYYPSEPLEVSTHIHWFDKNLPIYPHSCVGVLEILDNTTKKLCLRKELYSQNFVDYKFLAKVQIKLDHLIDLVRLNKVTLIISLCFFSLALYYSRRAARKKIE